MRVTMLTGEDASVYRELRLSALALNPEAFLTMYDDYVNRPLSQIAGQLEPKDHVFTLGARTEDEQLAGVVTLLRETSPKMRHVASVQAMFVHPSYRRRGVGKLLLESILDAARQLPDIEQVKLTVVKDNVAAVALYESVGFTTYGLEPRALKTDGRYWDELHMALYFDAEPR